MSDEQVCEFPKENASPEEIRELLCSARVIAVVGLSDKPDRDSFRVASYLKEHGYRIIPVNPNVSDVLGLPAYDRLEAIPEPVDVVTIFRRPEAVPPIVDDAIRIGAKAVWMQLGIVHNAAAEVARQAGLTVVMNRCMMQEHRRLSQQGGCSEPPPS
ncbi:MAG: CoA-binding protein [Planctomycetes bacterium]|nr:CoA-binding protein [Planctomycetota bacterium]